MSKFKIGDRVRMPGVPIVVEVMEIGTCEDEGNCEHGGEVFWFHNPELDPVDDHDRAHSSEFEKAA